MPLTSCARGAPMSSTYSRSESRCHAFGVVSGRVSPRALVVVAVGARRGTASFRGRGLPRGHPPRGDEKARVAVHRVTRSDRETLDVPVPDESLPGVRLGEAAVDAKG